MITFTLMKRNITSCLLAAALALCVLPNIYANEEVPELKGEIFTIEELDVAPTLVNQKVQVIREITPEDVYGSATAVFVISRKGQPQQINVLEATDSYFEKAARKTISNWRYKPGMLDGSKVATAYSVKLNMKKQPKYYASKFSRHGEWNRGATGSSGSAMRGGFLGQFRSNSRRN